MFASAFYTCHLFLTLSCLCFCIVSTPFLDYSSLQSQLPLFLSLWSPPASLITNLLLAFLSEHLNPAHVPVPWPGPLLPGPVNSPRGALLTLSHEVNVRVRLIISPILEGNEHIRAHGAVRRRLPCAQRWPRGDRVALAPTDPGGPRCFLPSFRSWTCFHLSPTHTDFP